MSIGLAALALALTGSLAGLAAPSARAPLERSVRAPLERVERALDSGPAGADVRTAIGASVRNRAIRSHALPGTGSAGRVLVVGCIHGDECAGIRVVRGLARGVPPRSDVVAVPNLNPDGLAAHARVNAQGVDLNRNFPSGWDPTTSRGDLQHSGPSPLSEPESRLARRLVLRLRPDATIWFHQQRHSLVRAWGPSVPAGRAYARLVGMAFHRLPWLPGTAPHWQNTRFPGTSSFVVELPRGRPGPRLTRAHVAAIAALAPRRDRSDPGDWQR